MMVVAQPASAVASDETTTLPAPERRVALVEDLSTLDQLGRTKAATDAALRDAGQQVEWRGHILSKPESVAAVGAKASGAGLKGDPVGSPPVDPDPPAQFYVRATQEGQINAWYCGPAVLVATLNQRPYRSPGGQSWAGSVLGTTTNGTDKANFHSAINRYTTEADFAYDRIDLPYTPTLTDKANFRARLKVTLQRTFGLVGVTYEVNGGLKLNGHPDPLPGKPIFHYFNIRGYSSEGAYTHYQDSATTVWSTVPAYSYINTNTVVTIMGGKGYWW